MTLSNEIALRIALAARTLPDTDAARLLKVLDDAVGLPPTQKKLAALKVKDLKNALDGEFAEAERLANEALRLGVTTHGSHVEGLFGVQMFSIRREQGRLAEVAPVIKRLLDDDEGDAPASRGDIKTFGRRVCSLCGPKVFWLRKGRS